MAQFEDDGPEPVVVLKKSTTAVDEKTGKTVFKPTREFMLAFASLLMICLAVAFDATTLSVALPIMSTAIGGTALEAFWSGTSFLLASTVFQPTVASLSSIFGRSYLIYVCAAFFAAGAIIAALANDFTVIIVGRAIQGTGGGGLIALTEVVTTDLVPLAYRGQWFSMISAVWSIGTVTGPLIGAGFAQNVSWRWIFWINLPVIAVGIVMVIFFLRQAKVPGHIVAKLKRFDWLGSFLFTAGSTSFLFGISTGGVMYEWDSWRTIVSIIVGAAVLVAFALWEIHFAERVGTEPLIDKGIFNNWTMVSTYIQTVLHGAILWSLLYFLVLYYQACKFYSPITSAVAILPETLTVAPAAMVVGVVATMTGRYRWALWTGWVFATFGAGILYLLDRTTSVPAWIFLNLPIGIGTGMLFPGMALSIQAACVPRLNAVAAAFFSFLRTFGQSIGVAVSGVIFQNVLRDKLAALPLWAARADELSRDATIVVDMIKAMEDGEAKTQMVDAYADALRMIWVSLIAMAGVSLILSFTVKGYSLNQEFESQQAFVGRSGEAQTEERTDVEKEGGSQRKEEGSGDGVLSGERTSIESGQVVETR